MLQQILGETFITGSFYTSMSRKSRVHSTKPQGARLVCPLSEPNSDKGDAGGPAGEPAISPEVRA